MVGSLKIELRDLKATANNRENNDLEIMQITISAQKPDVF